MRSRARISGLDRHPGVFRDREHPHKHTGPSSFGRSVDITALDTAHLQRLDGVHTIDVTTIAENQTEPVLSGVVLPVTSPLLVASSLCDEMLAQWGVEA